MHANVHENFMRHVCTRTCTVQYTRENILIQYVCTQYYVVTAAVVIAAAAFPRCGGHVSWGSSCQLKQLPYQQNHKSIDAYVVIHDWTRIAAGFGERCSTGLFIFRCQKNHVWSGRGNGLLLRVPEFAGQLVPIGGFAAPPRGCVWTERKG